MTDHLADLPATPRAREGLASVLPSVAAGLGVSGFDATFDFDVANRVVVLVIDGLGAQQLAEFAATAPFLSSMTPVASHIDAVFPTTTPTGLTSIGTGLAPGEHGIVAAAFRLDHADALLRPLHWGHDPRPHDVQPNATVWEQAAWSGVHVAAVSPRAYHESGLTNAALRGARAVGADSPGEVSTEVGRELRAADRALVYAYHPTLDRTGHVHGPGSPAWLADLAHVDLLARATAEALPAGATMVVTADHGMVTVSPEGRINVSADPALALDVVGIGGEPRMRLLYVRRGAVDDVVRRWVDRLDHAAWVLPVDDAISAGWFGFVDADVRSRLGDVVVIAREGYVMQADFDRRTANLIGQHGSLTPAEVQIPLLQLRS